MPTSGTGFTMDRTWYSLTRQTASPNLAGQQVPTVFVWVRQ